MSFPRAIVNGDENSSKVFDLRISPKVTRSLFSFETPGLGTYRGYIDGGQVKIDFAPAVGIGTTSIVNTVQVLMCDDASALPAGNSDPLLR